MSVLRSVQWSLCHSEELSIWYLHVKSLDCQAWNRAAGRGRYQTNCWVQQQCSSVPARDVVLQIWGESAGSCPWILSWLPEWIPNWRQGASTAAWVSLMSFGDYQHFSPFNRHVHVCFSINPNRKTGQSCNKQTVTRTPSIKRILLWGPSLWTGWGQTWLQDLCQGGLDTRCCPCAEEHIPSQRQHIWWTPRPLVKHTSHHNVSAALHLSLIVEENLFMTRPIFIPCRSGHQTRGKGQ